MVPASPGQTSINPATASQKMAVRIDQSRCHCRQFGINFRSKSVSPCGKGPVTGWMRDGGWWYEWPANSGLISMLKSFLNSLAATYSPTALFWSWGTVFLTLLVFHALERIRPVDKDINYKDVRSSWLITIVFLALSPIAAYIPNHIVSAAMQYAGAPWYRINFMGMLEGAPAFARVLALLPLLLLPTLFFDFFYYWFHRLQHSNKWLWEQHKLHHAEQTMSAATALRHHWLEEAMRSMIMVIPLSLFVAITPVEAGILGMIVSKWGYFVHMNARINFGVFNRLIGNPHVHRIHHSVEPQHWNKNFAAYCPAYDILFGTFHCPKPDEFPKTGVAGETSNPSVKEIVLGPFPAWARMVKETGRDRLSATNKPTSAA